MIIYLETKRKLEKEFSLCIMTTKLPVVSKMLVVVVVVVVAAAFV